MLNQTTEVAPKECLNLFSQVSGSRNMWQSRRWHSQQTKWML